MAIFDLLSLNSSLMIIAIFLNDNIAIFPMIMGYKRGFYVHNNEQKWCDLMNWYFVLLGAFGLVFRYWIANYKLNHLLKHRTGHLSRMITYFFFIAMMTDFGQNIFTLIIVGALPAMIAAFIIFDVSFYRHIFTEDWAVRMGIPEAHPKERFWIFLERFTLHWPAIVPGIVIYYRDPREFFLPGMDFQSVFVAGGMMIVAFFLLDPRWWKIEPNGQRSDHPAGKVILPAIIASMLGLIIYLYVDFETIFSSILM